MVRLRDCPEGLFLYEDTLAVMTEYATQTRHNPYQRDAYIVESGEYFVGGDISSLERDELMVTPLDHGLMLAFAQKIA